MPWFFKEGYGETGVLCDIWQPVQFAANDWYSEKESFAIFWELFLEILDFGTDHLATLTRRIDYIVNGWPLLVFVF